MKNSSSECAVQDYALAANAKDALERVCSGKVLNLGFGFVQDAGSHQKAELRRSYGRDLIKATERPF